VDEANADDKSEITSDQPLAHVNGNPTATKDCEDKGEITSDQPLAHVNGNPEKTEDSKDKVPRVS
jgi:hypothetical protein